jgi:hypothetical protein
LLAAFALSLALTGADAYLKRAPHAGFMLPRVEWTMRAGDLPAAWAAFERSPVFSRVDDGGPEVYKRFGVWMRRETHVRWTPLRWHVWFGRPLAVSGTAEGWVASCRPGLLARIAFRLGAIEPAAWRDGFLLVGSSAALVEQLRAHGVSIPRGGARDTIAWEHIRDRAAEVTIGFDGEWEITGWISVDSERGVEGEAVRRTDDWPGAPALDFYTAGGDSFAELLPETWPDFPLSGKARQAWDDFLARLPRGWDADADSYHFALAAVDTRGTLPVPELGVILRSQSRFRPLAAPERAIPYTWGVTRGWMDPWRGEPMSLYAAAGPRIRVFTNQEPTIAALLDRPLTGRIVSYDARLRADLTQLAAIAKALTRTAAEVDLLPGRNVDDAEREIFPMLNALAAIGEIQLEGRYSASRLEFAGGTRPPAPREGPAG